MTDSAATVNSSNVILNLSNRNERPARSSRPPDIVPNQRRFRLDANRVLRDLTIGVRLGADQQNRVKACPLVQRTPHARRVRSPSDRYRFTRKSIGCFRQAQQGGEPSPGKAAHSLL